MSWNEGLTHQQEKAAGFTGAHSRLLAGPGTGKTLCLTRRAIFLIKELSINPSNILILTFTRAAMYELRNRILKELGSSSFLPVISTLHSFALVSILRSHVRLRLPYPIRIADDYEEQNVIYPDLKANIGLHKKNEIEKLFNQLSANWDTADPDWEIKFPNAKFIGAWRDHRTVYGYSIRNELVYQLYLSLIDKSINPQYFSRILIDEYQDLNPCDLGVVKNLVLPGTELFVAGDDDQSIYRFRYANPDGIRNFHNIYFPNENHELSVCLRSDPQILELAAYIARQDPKRLEKKLVSNSSNNSGEVKLLFFPDYLDEAKGVAKLCQILINEKEIKPHEIIILVRSNKDKIFSTPIKEELLNLSIPVIEKTDAFALFNCPKDDVTNKYKIDGRLLLCYLRLMDNIEDSLSWRVIFELDKTNNIGKKKIADIYNYALDNGLTFHQALTLFRSNKSNCFHVYTQINNTMLNVENKLNEYRKFQKYDLQTFLIEVTNLVVTNVNDRKEVNDVFHRVIQATDCDNLTEMLRLLNTPLDDKEQDVDNGGINIMTMHQAKGLTAKAVFIIALEDEYIPGRSIGAEEKDALRLLYVSITRAKNFLYLSYCNRRTGRQKYSGANTKTTSRKLTRFLYGGTLTPEDGKVMTNI